MKVLQTFALPLGYGTFGPPVRGFPRANGIVAWGVGGVNRVLTGSKTVLQKRSNPLNCASEIDRTGRRLRMQNAGFTAYRFAMKRNIFKNARVRPC